MVPWLIRALSPDGDAAVVVAFGVDSWFPRAGFASLAHGLRVAVRLPWQGLQPRVGSKYN